MNQGRPGLNPDRLIRLMRRAIEACRLDLSGTVVLTEAATGAYVVTPVLAALAGAGRVVALTRTTRYGTFDEVKDLTLDLAGRCGVASRIEVVAGKTPELVAAADIVTNSGHVRPIDAATIGQMRPTAVIPLMYEAWEFRPEDLDMNACRARGVRVAGTNERHPAVDVFSDLGMMAVKQLLDAGIAVRGCALLLLCDNEFESFIRRGLESCGAEVTVARRLNEAPTGVVFDALVLALHPRAEPAVDASAVRLVARQWPGAVLAQYWGDLDRAAAREAGLHLWPPDAPHLGHMGILPSAIGPDPIVRLQCGGLKVGEVLTRGDRAEPPDRAFVQELAP